MVLCFVFRFWISNINSLLRWTLHHAHVHQLISPHYHVWVLLLDIDSPRVQEQHLVEEVHHETSAGMDSLALLF